MKKIIKTILLIFFLILIIPTIEASVKETIYTNYYFFLEPYYKEDVENINHGKKSGTINYTSFPQLENGAKELLNAKYIPLSRNCKQEENDECWKYTTFYSLYADAEVHNGIYEEGNKKYYAHQGKYWNAKEQKWIQSDWTKLETSQFISCASVYLTANLKIVNKNLKETDIKNIKDGEEFYIQIQRNLEKNKFTNINFDNDINYNSNISSCPSDNVTPVKHSDGQPVVYSPVAYKYQYKVIENKCDIVKPESELSCNGSNTLKSDCSKLTIKTTNATVDVKISQTGVVSSILTPTTLYAGGGFKFGILYTNTITWDYVNSISQLSTKDKNEVVEQMKNKLKSINDFTSGLNLNNVKFGNNTIDANFFKKNCTTKGTFNAGETVTTTCTIYLPESLMDDYTGNVTYGIGTNKGINNKYYTKTTEEGNYIVSGTIEGLSRLTDTSAITDGNGTNKWTGNWSVELKDCNINIYSLLQQKDGKYKFIYRPININNPFPNRNAGINWFDWYNITSNKERLKDTYKNLNYTIELDNKTLTDVKKYNDGKTYFDFDTMNGDESTFLKTYFPNAKVGGS